MNRPILCCLKIKQATLFVGVIDLILHLMVLTCLFALYTHPNLFDQYYTNSLSMIVSPSSSFYSASIKNVNDQSATVATISTSPSAVTAFINSNSNFLTASSTASPLPSMSFQNNQLYQQWQLKVQQSAQYKFKQSLQMESSADMPSYTHYGHPSTMNMSRDRSIAFLVTSFSSFLTLMLIYGIMKNRPSYLMPYFSIKVFQVVMGCLTTLGFYSCLPNVRLWIEQHHFFPMKKELLVLQDHTLELFVFSILLTSILVKLYVVIIVWYCYRYMVALKSFMSINSSLNNGMSGVGGCTTANFSTAGIYSYDSSNGFKMDDESLISGPPKYEEIIKQIKRESSNANASNTSTSNNLVAANASLPTTSTSLSAQSSSDLIVPLVENVNEHQPNLAQTNETVQGHLAQSPPTYVAAILKKKKNDKIVV